MTATVEANNTPLDPTELAKREVRQEVEQLKDPQGVIDQVKKQSFFEKLKQAIVDKFQAAKEVREAHKKKEALPPEAKLVQQSIVKLFEAIRLKAADTPQESKASSIVEKLVNMPLPSERTASFLQPFLQKAYTNTDYVKFSDLNNPNTSKTEFEQDFEEISRENPDAARALREALKESAREGKLPGITEQNIEQKFVVQAEHATALSPEDLQKQLQQQQQSYDRNDGQLLNMLGKDPTPQAREAAAFYASIDKPADFKNFYKEKLKQKLGGLDPDTAPKNLLEEASKKVSAEITEHIIFTVNRIYSEVLAQQTDDAFKRKAQESGSMYDNAQSRYSSFFNKLNSLGDQMGYDEMKGTPFYKITQEGREEYNPDRQRVESHGIPKATLQQTSLKEFTERLKEIAKLESGLLEYGFNFNLLINNGPDPEKGFFGQVRSYAERNLNSESFDMMYALPYNEVIESARISLEQMYKRMFAKYEWKKVPELGSEMFDTLNQAERKTLNELIDNYLHNSDETKRIPEWAIKRAFYHARMEFFGKDFMFQLMTSYADPNSNVHGEASYKSEGVFASNSMFDRMEAAKRWQSDDPELKGMVYMPKNKLIENFDHKKIIDRGRKLFLQSFDDGELSYFEDEYFDGTTPIIAEHNMTRTGGIDALGGWRLRAAYTPWIADIVDLGNERIKMVDGVQTKDPGEVRMQVGQDVLVKGWKNVENIGVNILKNFSEQYLFGNTANFAIENGKPKHGAQYEEFFKFLHKRYFSEGVGTAFSGAENEESFMKNIKKILSNTSTKPSEKAAQLQSITQQALTVALYERTPLEFMFMEKRRSSQNGVTLQSEMMDHFVGQGSNKWDLSKWDATLDDLIFVQQEARVESIKDMDKIRENDPRGTNLYGDFDQGTSQVLGGRGYKIDESYIRQKLTEKFGNDTERIERSVEFHKELTEKVKQKPSKGNLELKWEKNDKSKAKRARENMKERVVWFNDAWKDYKFGMTFTGDTAGQFMNRAATGPETVARGAGYCQFTAEVVKNAMNPGAEGMMWDTAKNVGRSGDFSGIPKFLSAIKTPIKGEDGDLASEVTAEMFQETLLILRRDTAATKLFGREAYSVAKRKTSIAASFVEEGTAYDLDAEGVGRVVSNVLAKAVIPKHTKPDKRVYREIKASEKGISGKIANSIYKFSTGKDLMLKQRDWAREMSGDAIEHFANAGNWVQFKKSFIPNTLMVFFALSVLFGKKGMEDLKVV